MVRSFQISAVFQTMTARENVRVALQAARNDCFAFWRGRVALNVLDRRARRLARGCRPCRRARSPRQRIAYGQRRALELATTLALEPELLLLDEPTAGMGREDVGRIAALIRRVARERTVLMVEHNLSVVADLSDRITVLARGEMLAEGTYAEVANNEAVAWPIWERGMTERRYLRSTACTASTASRTYPARAFVRSRRGRGASPSSVATAPARRRRCARSWDCSSAAPARSRSSGAETIAALPEMIARLGVGYVPEERGIYASLDVTENLLLPPKLAPTVARRSMNLPVVSQIC